MNKNNVVNYLVWNDGLSINRIVGSNTTLKYKFWGAILLSFEEDSVEHSMFLLKNSNNISELQLSELDFKSITINCLSIKVLNSGLYSMGKNWTRK